MKKILLVLFGVMLLCSIPLTASAITYRVIDTGIVTWDVARAQAQALGAGWDLASITSAAKESAVEAALAAHYASINEEPVNRNEFWVGGFRTGTNLWGEWVSGEAWDYEYWWGGEPNYLNNDEHHLAIDWRVAGFTGNNGPSAIWMWNDEGSAPAQIRGFVAQSVPEPTSMLLLGLGLVGLAGIRRKK